MRGERPITKKQAGLPRVTLWRPEWDGTPSALLFFKDDAGRWFRIRDGWVSLHAVSDADHYAFKGLHKTKAAALAYSLKPRRSAGRRCSMTWRRPAPLGRSARQVTMSAVGWEWSRPSDWLLNERARTCVSIFAMPTPWSTAIGTSFHRTWRVSSRR